LSVATPTRVTTAIRPIRYVPEPPRRIPTTAVAARPLSCGQPFDVLLVEDDDDEILIVQRTMRRAGLTDEARVVRDGRTALDLLLGPNAYAASPLVEVPDVVVLDLGLPRVSGLDVLRRLKENALVADIPVVVLSGANDEGTARTCMNLGASMYLVKPISHVEAMNVVVAVHEHWLAVENFSRFDAAWEKWRAA
jgi:CheY-like chemotaxis protein